MHSFISIALLHTTLSDWRRPPNNSQLLFTMQYELNFVTSVSTIVERSLQKLCLPAAIFEDFVAITVHLPSDWMFDMNEVVVWSDVGHYCFYCHNYKGDTQYSGGAFMFMQHHLTANGIDRKQFFFPCKGQDSCNQQNKQQNIQTLQNRVVKEIMSTRATI